MISFIFIVILICLCLSLFSIYLFIQFRRKSSNRSEIQRIKYSISPSIDIFAKKFSQQFHLDTPSSTPIRSQSLANNIFLNKCSNRRQSAIVDSKQMAMIEFALPPGAEKFRRRSIGICNNLIESKQSTIDSIIRRMPFTEQLSVNLITFSITFCQSSQILVEFQSFPENFQQLTIKIKLFPEGKTKKIIFNEHNSDESSVHFNHISSLKLSEKSLLMKFYGKDSTKKIVHLGQIGKIHFNQLPNLHNEHSLQFLHQLEVIKLVRNDLFHSLHRILSP